MLVIALLQKNKKNAQLIPSKISIKVIFVTPGMNKIGNMVKDFCFYPEAIKVY